MGPSKGFIEGRARGVYFDTGTGGGSFKWSLAVPMIKQGFKPDSISTDLHVDSMNSATKDMLNVASKLMAIGLSLQEVVADMTAHPAHQIKRDDLGNLSVGSVADVAVLSIQKGHFGFTDMVNTRVDGTQKLVDELTIKDGRIVYDLNGLEALPWNAPQGDSHLDARWTTFPRPVPRPTDGVHAALTKGQKRKTAGTSLRLPSPFFVTCFSFDQRVTESNTSRARFACQRETLASRSMLWIIGLSEIHPVGAVQWRFPR